MTAPPSPPYIPARYQGGPQKPRRIVIHGTVSPTVRGGARAVARYFQAPRYQSSAHYVVDPYEEIQCVYDKTQAWHDGHNKDSIGVELCDLVEGPLSRWDDEPHELMLARAARLVRQLCLAYDIPMDKIEPAQIRAGRGGIHGHDDTRDAFPGATTHWDPGAFPWSRFIALVRSEAEEDDMQLSDRVELTTKQREYFNGLKSISVKGLLVYGAMGGFRGPQTDDKVKAILAEVLEAEKRDLAEKEN